ncbi:hypothetical protein OBBRIDRAFT_801400 [Obba rivulosa]|uniref:Uncharacterized protein n=1 Tax=Obba rivulosa TaxID=1052685 RepID=A0A8E2DR77_9APHY|nr:hypothetical protein OBBRIDRAFT_801400 [Obba rivulosa]
MTNDEDKVRALERLADFVLTITDNLFFTTNPTQPQYVDISQGLQTNIEHLYWATKTLAGDGDKLAILYTVKMEDYDDLYHGYVRMADIGGPDGCQKALRAAITLWYCLSEIVPVGPPVRRVTKLSCSSVNSDYRHWRCIILFAECIFWDRTFTRSHDDSLAFFVTTLYRMSSSPDALRLLKTVDMLASLDATPDSTNQALLACRIRSRSHFYYSIWSYKMVKTGRTDHVVETESEAGHECPTGIKRRIRVAASPNNRQDISRQLATELQDENVVDWRSILDQNSEDQVNQSNPNGVPVGEFQGSVSSTIFEKDQNIRSRGHD